MSSVYSAENPADGSSVFVPTCQLTRFSNPGDHDKNCIENWSQGSRKFSRINLCLKMALNNNNADTDCCEAVLRKCNVKGQTLQLTEYNFVT